MTNKTAFYYMEITAPNADDNIIGYVRNLLDLHIEETNSKNSRIAKESVFTHIKTFNKVGNTQAILLEFANERQYDTYLTVIAEFRAWALEHHNVSYGYEADHNVPFELLSRELETDKRYVQTVVEYMTETLPRERGFI